MFSRFDTIPAFNGRTDGRTDVKPIAITCFSIADARKKYLGLHENLDSTLHCWRYCKCVSWSSQLIVTRGHSIEMHNSRRPFDRLTVYTTIGGSVKEQPHWSSMAVERGYSNILAAMLLQFVTLWPWPLTFWPNINCWARYRDGLSLCQFWRFDFQPFRFYRADRITDSITSVSYTHLTLPTIYSV